MTANIGKVLAIYRYPVKSMAGEKLDSATIGWHGIEGDRRFAFYRKDVRNGFPWLTASKLPQLIRYQPLRNEDAANSELPTHIRTPQGAELELTGAPLRQELTDSFGAPVDVMQLNQGIFDEAHISIISTATIRAIEEAAGMNLDVRRFRPNILIETADNRPFADEQWIGKAIRIGTGAEAVTLQTYLHDIRCVMVNIDPESGELDNRVMKAVVRLNENRAGVYARVIGPGRVAVADHLYLQS